MDDVTRQVAAQYERYPYPMDPTQIRADAFVDWLLAQVQRAPRGGIRVLDAGCGTGSGAVPVAEMYPHAEVVGVDLSERALAAAREVARRAGVDNLRLERGDLVTLEGVPTTEGGYDIIYASGVLHHLSDPARGLRNLRGLLAPDGVLVLMVYDAHGRAPVFRFARAMDRIWPDRADWDRRVPLARALLEALPACAVNAPPWDDAAAVPDNELVDRYLHAHDRGYTVPGLFALLDDAGLSHLRWLEPRVWSPTALLGAGQAAALLEALPPRQRYEVMDLLFDHPSLTALVTHPEARARPLPADEALLSTPVALNPQVALATTTRRVGGHAFVTDLEATVRGLAPQRLGSVQAALAQTCTEPMPGAELVARARRMRAMDDEAATAALAELLSREILFAPHL